LVSTVQWKKSPSS